MNSSEQLIIDEQAQTKLKGDEPINENNNIEDNNDQNYDNTLIGSCNKNMYGELFAKCRINSPSDPISKFPKRQIKI